MRFTETYTVSWHDTDAGRVARPSRLLTALQETANHQCGTYGKDLDRMRDEDGKGFILTRLELRFGALCRAGDVLELSTWISSAKALSTIREFRIRKGEETVLEGSGSWVLVDTGTRALLKVEEYPYPYPADEPLPFAPPMRLKLPPLEPVGHRRIVYSDTDYNGHMNNTRYPDLLMDFLPDGIPDEMYPKRMVILYHSGAPAGENLEILRGPMPDSPYAYGFEARGADGKTCFTALVELRPRG